MDNQQDYQRLQSNLSNQWWRLNNLYYIKDKQGKKVKFRLNWAQKDFYNNLHYFNTILKARQLGFTTFTMIYFLDACLFNSNHSAGVIAHTLDDAQKLFKDKIKFAYDGLPASIKKMKPAKSDSARTLEFSNGSSIYVGTSLRGGTNQKLLISEYGKISAKYPEKAKEIKTGALNTIAQGQQIIIESTAEGRSGEFYEQYEKARKLINIGRPLATMEAKAFFYSWWQNPEYIATDEEVENIILEDDYIKYFDGLGDEGIELMQNQKVWYQLKAEQQGDEMSQEYPSTPDEAFQGSQKGAFYTKQLKQVRERGQITNVPYNPKHEVYTWWDLGLNDLMTVWFSQFIDGKHMFVDYHESSGEGWDYYALMLKEKGYNYARHNFPHDGNKRIRGKEVYTDRQIAMQCGIRPIKVTPVTKSAYNDIINFCQPIIPQCYFDASKCAKGILHLDNYKKKWSKADGMFMKEPEHDEASHGSDGFRTFAVNAEKLAKEFDYVEPPREFIQPSGGWMG